MSQYLTPDDVAHMAAEHFSITHEAITGPSKRRPWVEYRMAAMAAARHLTGASWPEIARAFGGRDHTTAINAGKRARSDERIRRLTDNVIAAVRGSGHGGTATWAVTASCDCGWSTDLELPDQPSVAELIEAYRTLERAERDHLHRGAA